MLTNQTTKKFVEPRLLIVIDPRTDYNVILESSYVNIPVIGICNTDNNLKLEKVAPITVIMQPKLMQPSLKQKH